MHIETNAVARAVVHPGHAVGTLVAGRRGAEATIDEDLAHSEVDVVARHAGPDHLDACIERLQGSRVHSMELFRNLADDHGAGEVTVAVAGAAAREEVPGPGAGRADLAPPAVGGSGPL